MHCAVSSSLHLRFLPLGVLGKGSRLLWEEKPRRLWRGFFYALSTTRLSFMTSDR